MNGFLGKFIVIDGTDGSGKTTQLGLLQKRLAAEGHAVALADFPQYNTKSAGPVEEYLSGKYGAADAVSAYQASIFYAVDRWDASFKIRRWLTEGKIVLANRYTSANMAHQGGKIANPLERRVFFNWLYDLEYKVFGIPQPDLCLILHVEPAIAQELVRERAREDWNGKTADIHEDDLEHLRQAERVYREIAGLFPDFRLISCTKDEKIFSREEIHLLIWPIVKKVINHQADGGGHHGFRPIGQLLGANEQILNNRDIIFERFKNFSPAVTSDSPATAPNQAAKNPTPMLTPRLNEHESAPGHKLAVERISPHAKLPQKAHQGDAAYDLYASDYYSLPPYGQALVATGIRLAIPDGYVGLIWDKSGLAAGGITTLGGVIDANYRGDVKVVVKNLSEEIFHIVPGQKIAQILIQAAADWIVSEEPISDQTERQASGFGSSGQF
jgi:dTMP kinase